MTINLKQLYQQRYGIKQPLRGYQRRAAAFGLSRNHFALLMSPRLGKTRVVVAVAGARAKRKQVKRWVVICPSIAKDVWATEISQTLTIPHHIGIIEGKALERKLMLKGWEDQPGKLSILIINHEATWRLKKFLYKWNPDMATVDESHKIKNHASKQAGSIAVLGRRASYRNILTGTFSTTPMDVFGQFKFLDPSLLPTSIKDFREEYVASYGFGGHKPKKFKNLDKLNSIVNSTSFIMNREQAGGFPEELYQVIRFELTNPALKHYNEMQEKLKTMVQGEEVKAAVIVTQALRLQQITGGFLPVLDPDEDLSHNVPIGNDRIRALQGLLNEYSVDEPLVIFAKFRYELLAVIEAAKKAGRSTNFIAGGMRSGERDQAKWDFQEGKVDTCVVQVRAGGIAIDLSRADNAIFYSSPHSYFDREQALARIIARTGGKKSFIDLVARGTVDEEILQAGKEKKSLAEIITKKFK